MGFGKKPPPLPAELLFGTNIDALIANGYGDAIIPIQNGEKGCYETGWTTRKTFTSKADREQYANYGIGFRTKSFPAIDIDVSNKKLADEIYRRVTKKLGIAPERVGRAPRRLLYFRLKGKPFSKLHTGEYTLPGDAPADRHRVEILADGEMFVGYNNHATTRRPYNWNGTGSPLETPASALPTITRQQGEELVVEIDMLIRKRGGVSYTKSDTKKLKSVSISVKNQREVGVIADQRASDPALLRSALAHIPNDDMSYDDWIGVGMALKGALGEDGLQDFLNWSENSKQNKGNRDGAAQKWKSFKPHRKGAGTIFHMAKEAGWRWPAPKLRTTEGGLADLFVSQYANDVRYDNDEECWYAWNGILWKPEPRKAPDIQERVKKTIAGVIEDAGNIRDDDERKRIRKWAAQSDRQQVIHGAMTLASSDPQLRVSMDRLDQDPLLLGTQSGIVDLRTGEMIKSTRTNLVTRSVAVRFEPTAECPRWKQFIQEIMLDDAEMIAFIQRFVGYLLLGGNPLRLIFFLYGIGRNGKSVFIETLLKLMGDYGEPAKSELIMKHRADRDPESAQPFMLKLRGKRYITASEVGEGMQLDAAVVKTLTGGDALTVRGLRVTPVKFTIEGKFVIRCNHRPVIDGADQAIWDRVVEIPFDMRLEEAEQDTTLHSVLFDELPGILNWAVQGCLDYQQSGLALPDKVRAQTKNYRDSQDSFLQWLEERAALDTKHRVGRSMLFADYENWCVRRSTRLPTYPISQKAFGAKLIEKGCQAKKSHGNQIWRGVRLKEAA